MIIDQWNEQIDKWNEGIVIFLFFFYIRSNKTFHVLSAARTPHFLKSPHMLQGRFGPTEVSWTHTSIARLGRHTPSTKGQGDSFSHTDDPKPTKMVACLSTDIYMRDLYSKNIVIYH